MSSAAGEALRLLPSIETLLQTGTGRRLSAEFSPTFVADCARSLVEEWRQAVHQGTLDAAALGSLRLDVEARLEAAVRRVLTPSLVSVINASGVVVHTNLGRAPWPRSVAERALGVAQRYSNLEYNLARGSRGQREQHLGALERLFGAEAALVVNNCAAAVLLILNTLADGRETVVSRGELVEIGGSFRIPEILAKSGSTLREVGTTNRTRLADYERAIGERTGVLLKVHPSNFRVLGFTEAVALSDLAALGRRRGVPVVEDLGSGDVIDLARVGVGGETTVGVSLAAGADLVAVSGDKLMGGPQAGIILGSAALMGRLHDNPLYRALRPDKVTLAALGALASLYETRDPWREVPVLAMLAADPVALAARAERLALQLAGRGYRAEVIAGASTVGGGAAPLSAIPGPLVAIRHPASSAATLEALLRRNRPPIVARVEDERVIVDLRTVFLDEDEVLAAAFPPVG